MNHSFYYEGRQIKNYLVGFASLFSEIPYQNRKGQLESVPIHYGSPSDIISFLEMNVDNEDTHNRNRLKDVSVPLFSFRMTSMEKNLERRRAPLDSITVDLRPLGYSTGYVAMKPAPFRFNMELLLWASSDYQAFEIVEQIVPYFNSPQQVSIEPLPRCPVSTTEIFMESFEIDTEPDSQKYSALVTMTFNLTGWLLSQPRIWSTNMKFELSMLDKENINNGVNLDDTDYSVGHEIIDTNTINYNKTKEEQSLETVEDFIRLTPLNDTYGEKLDWYDELVKAGRIDSDTGQILNRDLLTIEYKGKEKILYPETMDLLIDDMEDVKYIYKNELLRDMLSSQTINDDVKAIQIMQDDLTETIEIYLILLDNNLVTKDFNRTDVPISNADKLNMFSTPRIDIDQAMNRMKSYLSSIENLKVKTPIIKSTNVLEEDFSVFIFNLDLPLSSLPTIFKEVDNIEIDYDITDIVYTKPKYNNLTKSITLTASSDKTPETITMITADLNGDYSQELIDIEYNLDGSFNFDFKIVPGKVEGLNLVLNDGTEKAGFNSAGIYIVDNRTPTSITDDTFLIFGEEANSMIEYELNYSKIFNAESILNMKFLDMNTSIVATLLFNKFKHEKLSKNDILINPLYKIMIDKFDDKGIPIDIDIFFKLANDLLKTTSLLSENLNKLNNPDANSHETKEGIKIIAPDLAVVLTLDKDGNPIYDANQDGYIDIEDLKILGSNVDNPEDFDFEIKYGIWYKRFRPENMAEDRIKRISGDLKIIYYLTEKNDMSELKDYLTLWQLELVSDGFDIYEDEIKQQEIKALGYDLIELDNKLLFFRLFVNAIKNIMITERDYILYKVEDMNDESKRILYKTEGLNIDKIVMSKFIERYFKVIINEDDSILDDKLFREILPTPMGDYYAEAYNFNLMWLDIKNTQFFKDSLDAYTPWLDEQLPEVTEKINNL